MLELKAWEGVHAAPPRPAISFLLTESKTGSKPNCHLPMSPYGHITKPPSSFLKQIVSHFIQTTRGFAVQEACKLF